MMLALCGRKYECMRALLECKAQCDLGDEGGHGNNNTPLMLAAELNDRNAIQLLLEHGADPTIADAQGWTALSRATGNKVAALLRRPAAMDQ